MAAGDITHGQLTNEICEVELNSGIKQRGVYIADADAVGITFGQSSNKFCEIEQDDGTKQRAIYVAEGTV